MQHGAGGGVDRVSVWVEKADELWERVVRE
jgi:hypothetical protein